MKAIWFQEPDKTPVADAGPMAVETAQPLPSLAEQATELGIQTVITVVACALAGGTVFLPYGFDWWSCFMFCLAFLAAHRTAPTLILAPLLVGLYAVVGVATTMFAASSFAVVCLGLAIANYHIYTVTAFPVSKAQATRFRKFWSPTRLICSVPVAPVWFLLHPVNTVRGFYQSLSRYLIAGDLLTPGVQRSLHGDLRRRTQLFITVCALLSLTLSQAVLGISDSSTANAPPTAPATYRQDSPPRPIAQITAATITPEPPASTLYLFLFGFLAVVSTVPPAICLAVCFFISVPYLPAAAQLLSRQPRDVGKRWTRLMHYTTTSNNPQEQRSIPIGSYVETRNFAYIGKGTLQQHMAIFGGTGSGKTALVSRLIEWAIALGWSVVLNDLKFADNYLLKTMEWGGRRHSLLTGKHVPLQVVTNVPELESQLFLPLPQMRSAMKLLHAIDVFASAYSLDTDHTGHGEGWFGLANVEVLTAAIRRLPPGHFTFRDLARCIHEVLNDRSGLPSSIRKAGTRVLAVVNRLSQFLPLNGPAGGPTRKQLDNAVDFFDPDRSPCYRQRLIYFGLPEATNPNDSPELARCATLALFAACQRATLLRQIIGREQVPILCITDEASSVLSGKQIATVLQQSRSLQLHHVLCTQSLCELQAKGVDIPLLSNTGARIWLRDAALQDLQYLQALSGSMVTHSESYTRRSDGECSLTTTQMQVPRLSIEELQQIGTSMQAVVQCTAPDGLGKTEGRPYRVQLRHHISEREYQRRSNAPWPKLPGSVVDHIGDDLLPTFVPPPPTKRLDIEIDSPPPKQRVKKGSRKDRRQKRNDRNNGNGKKDA